MRHQLIAIALLVLAPAASLAAGNRGFQIEADAVRSVPIGTYESGDHASDLFGHGGAVFGKALYGLSRSLYVGVGAGYLQNSHDFGISFIAFGTPQSYTLTRQLDAVPVLAMAQLRSDTHSRLSWYGEGGMGMTTFTGRYSGIPGPRPTLAFFQQTFSFMLGGGACLGLGKTFDLLAGADYLQSFAGSGDVWQSGDNPAYVLYTAGLRYPRW